MGYRQNARKHGLHGLVLTELGQENEAADSLRYSRANDEQFFEAKIEPELDKIMQKRNLPSDPKAAKLAWELGTALGKAAFLSAQQGGSDKAKTALAGAAQYAKSLKVTVLALPPNGQSKEEDLRHAVEYLKQSRNKVAPEIDKAHGRQATMCLDLAMSSLTLLLVYQTNSPKLKTQLLDSIKRAGPQSGAPDQYWKPVVEKAEAGAPSGEFTAAVRSMLENVTKHFTAKANAQPAEEG